MNTKPSWLGELDGLLRGDQTRALREGRGTEALRLQAFIGSAVGLGVVYGVCMGLFAVMTRTPACWEQLVATAIKVPALFLFTLIVTFPSLYVFSALLGTRLRFVDVLRMLVAAITLNLCVLAAFGPITAFFTISTTSYAFMKLLNVAFFAVSGVLGLGFLMRALAALEEGPGSPASGKGGLRADPGPPAPPPLPGSAEASAGAGGARSRTVLSVWLVLYALVGAQMGWVLRPFIGDPGQAFQVFRGREANIFIDVVRSLGALFE